MSQYKLSAEIVAQSEAQAWDEAKLEWKLDHIYWEEEPDTCLCGHYPINELCILRNAKNGNTALVGNCCVKKFMGLPSDKIFQSLKKSKVMKKNRSTQRRSFMLSQKGGLPSGRGSSVLTRYESEC